MDVTSAAVHLKASFASSARARATIGPRRLPCRPLRILLTRFVEREPLHLLSVSWPAMILQ
jgi:hypothetical protein